ncbi:VOC family protein [Devosia sp. XK-2]|uniref:VOC family protein n=1 Tax=Devosia sp. XK-2 TaxID=3126689 RepID=UPI0030CBC7F6
MNDGSKLGAIGQIARTVRDVAAAKHWYGDVLGLPLLLEAEGMAFFDVGGVRLYLQQSEPAGAESILYFRVPDIAAAHLALMDRGVHFLQPPHRVHQHADGTEEWIAFFADPEDRPLALIAQVRPS